MQITRVGVDLAKNVFQVHGVDRRGHCVWKRQLKRSSWVRGLCEKLEPGCEIGMEACSGAHHWARALRERGFVVKLIAPKQLGALRRAIPAWLEDGENGLTTGFRALLNGLWQDLLRVDDRMEELDREIARAARSHESAKRLQQLRGVGPLVATALVAHFGDGSHFARGREAAVSIGLTPRHHGTGGKNRLLGITKRGDSYLRSILIHGARAVVSQADQKDDRLSRWVSELKARSHPNVAAVALANKTVRIAWSMLRHGTEYEASLATAQVKQ